MATAFDYLKECPVCKEEFTDPRVFPCDHSLCVSCISHIRKGNQIKCPECNAVHNVDKLRRDFRLIQFLDALKEERLKTSKKAPKQEGKPICDGCLSKSAYHWCNNCQQWLCQDCKNIHNRMAISKSHELEPISKNIEDISTNYAQEIKSIKSMFEDNSITLKELEDILSDLEAGKTEALEISANLRKKAIQDIAEYFDLINAKILSFIQEKKKILEDKRHEFQNKQLEVRSNYRLLEQMINNNTRDLLVEGEDILNELKNAQAMLTHISSEFEHEKVVIEVTEGTSWDPTTVASLTFRVEKVSQAVPQIMLNPPSAAGRTDSSSKLPITLLTKQHASRNVSGTLSLLTQTQFEKIGEVPGGEYCRTEYWLSGLSVIDNHLWLGTDCAIHIFDFDLKSINILLNEAWEWVRNITVMPRAGIVIACSKGLLHINQTGNTINEIDSGQFYGVDNYNSTLFASKRNTIFCYTYSGGIWFKQGSFLLRDSDTSISVKDNTITKCGLHTIDVYSMSGELLHTYGQFGTKRIGKFNNPRLCQQDSDGALLVADCSNHRLQLLNKYGQWSIVDVEPKPFEPRNAVFVDDTLYVRCGSKLCKYIAK